MPADSSRRQLWKKLKGWSARFEANKCGLRVTRAAVERPAFV
jgi:hypothetical protein